MYGTGNYAATVRQGPHTYNHPFQQRPLAPLPPFSQSPHPPLTTVVQQGPPPVPPQVGQLGRPVYHYAPPGPPQQGPPNPVLSGGINVQPFFTPAPPPPPPQPLQVHGSSQVQQNPQWTHGAPPFVPPAGPLSSPRVLPRPPSQGQTLFSSKVHQAPAGSIQAQTQPILPASSVYTSPLVGSFEYSKPQLSDTAPVGPPPQLPSPPLPSSPPRSLSFPPSPPPTSLYTFSKSHMSIPIPAASESAYLPEIGSRVGESSALETSASGSVGGVSAPYQVVHNGNGGSKTGSTQGDNLISDLPPPPPKPADDRTVRTIEVLCQFIAKNGPEFENMTRQKEFANPEFKFLFGGGESGSQAAVVHEYFLWTKRKYLLGFRSVGKQGSDDLSLRPSGDSSSDLNITRDVGVPYSPADSDMDMDDDITHPDEEPQSCSVNELSHVTVAVSNILDKEQDSQPLLSTAEHSHAKDAADGNFMHSVLRRLGEQRQGTETFSDQVQPVITKPFTNLDGLDANSSIDVEWRLVANVIKTAAPHEDLSQPNMSADIAETKLEKLPSQLVKQGASPFRLLQDYASDGSSDHSARFVDAVSTTAVPSVKVDAVPIDSDAGVDLGTYIGTESELESDKGLAQLPQSFKDSSVKPETVMVEADMPSTTGKSEDFVDNIYGNQESLKDSMSQREPRQNVVLRDDGVNVKKKENTESMSSKSTVDKYGRLIREGASDSESGGSPHYNCWQGKRGRSRSRSRSPHYSRRRRSPRRRKERRGLSRSLSPRRRRSRSKSPSFRHGGEFRVDKMRRDKGHRSECFDFIRGKCYRGASCRYLHHEDKSDRSRSYRSKQQFQDPSYSSRSSDFHGKFEMPYKKLSRKHDESRIQELKPFHNIPDTEEKKDMKEEMDEAATQFHDKSGPLEPLIDQIPDAKMEKIPGDTAQCRYSPFENSDLHQSQSHFSDRVSPNAGYQHQQMDTYGSKSSYIHTSVSILSHLPMDKAHLNEAENESRIDSSSMNKTFPPESLTSRPMVPTESISPAADYLSHLPPSFASVSQDKSSSFNQEMPRDYNLSSPAGIFPSHSASVENRPHYHSSVSYSHSQFPFPPNSSSSSVLPPPSHPPPPPAFVNDRTLTPGPCSGPSAHTMQNMLPPSNYFSSQTSARPCLTEFPTLLNVGKNQAYPPIEELNRLAGHLEDLHHPLSQAMSRLHGGSVLTGEDRFAIFPVPGLYSSNSFGQDNMLSQTMPLSKESPSKRTQAFPGDNLAPADGVSSLHRDHGNLSSTLSSYRSKLLERNQLSVLSDFGASRISKHCNPYASTFEQPLSSKFSSNTLLQENHRPINSQLGAAYSFSQVPVDGRDVASLGSRNLMSSQNSAQPVEGILSRPGDGQYDPLYDSIVPSLNSVRKSSYGQKCEVTDESDVIVRFSGSNKSLDEKEHKQQKGGESDEESVSLENEEYGETADGEVGAVENGSPGNLNDAAETAAGEVEIDQVKALGISKKSKESRSMKLFKIALADFVKEVLKPSWRQGNMSKEAFKTIVKKTVDRVSGAMKSHQIPKSQVKINHYIDSSQRKLTKLVMGYVDKYVKV